MTGETAAGPFTGHTDSVRFCGILARWPAHRLRFFRSNNSCVECHDRREIAAGPFTGHTVRVNSVAFSPDGQHIVSGSDDKTIRVWNAMTGETAAGPFTGHTDAVHSVAFSPDGQHIVSGSQDRTIRVWNAMTGETVAGPFTGHTDSVCLWHSRQMASTSSQVQRMEQFVCGMP
jgi:WD40 repeat protein